VGVGVVLCLQPGEHQAPQQPTSLCVDAVVARGPGFDAHQVEVGQAATRQSLDHPGVPLAVLLRLGKLVEHHRRLGTWRERGPRGQRRSIQIHDGFVSGAGAAVNEDRVGLPGSGLT